MPHTETWDLTYEARPSLKELIKDTGQQNLTGIKRNVRERLAVEHYFGLDTVSDGRHQFPSGPTSSRTNPPNQGNLFFNSDRWTPEFYVTGTGWVTFLLNDGSQILSFSTVIPLGWQLVNSFTDRVIRINPSVAGAGAVGGSWTISGFADAGAVNLSGSFTSGAPSATTTAAGAGNNPGSATHTHDTTVSFNIANHSHAFTPGWRPAYVDAYVMIKI